jgi:hypothetical protein
MGFFAYHCVDTKHGMVWKEDGSPMAMAHDFPNCRAAFNQWAACKCRAETVEQETK